MEYGVGTQHLGKPDTRLRRGQRTQFNEFDASYGQRRCSRDPAGHRQP